MILAEEIYRITTRFPRAEVYGMVAQMRKCAVSVPSNIAEGSQRMTNGEFSQFLGIARGSLAELQTQGILAFRLKYLSQEDAEYLRSTIDELGKMLHAFHRKVRTDH